MADSDALLVVEDWISEHFFTTDARKESYLARVLDRVKQWRDAEHPTTKSRFTAERSKLATAMAALYADEDPDPDAAALSSSSIAYRSSVMRQIVLIVSMLLLLLLDDDDDSSSLSPPSPSPETMAR